MIYACLHDWEIQETIQFATASSCLKHTIEGDYNLISLNEVLALANGDSSGQIQR